MQLLFYQEPFKNFFKFMACMRRANVIQQYSPGTRPHESGPMEGFYLKSSASLGKCQILTLTFQLARCRYVIHFGRNNTADLYEYGGGGDYRNVGSSVSNIKRHFGELRGNDFKRTEWSNMIKQTTITRVRGNKHSCYTQSACRDYEIDVSKHTFLNTLSQTQHVFPENFNENK
jgi:hypothetical protein